MRPFVPAIYVLTCFGCGDSGVVEPVDVSSPVDLVTDVSEPLDTGTPDSSAPEPVDPDSAVSDTIVDTNTPPSTCEPGEGCFGESCTSSDDCLSGICTMHLGDKVCSKTCDEACPTGWDCTLVGSGGDGQYVCMSKFSHLCLPCSDAGTCSGETPNACVQYAGGTRFCGGACDLETPCPSGYACQEVQTADGANSYQCVNTAGVCPCSNLAIDSALATPCEASNEEGTCQGVRICEESGLSECSASEPTLEVCNGIDDDCDGTIDETTCDDGNDCTVDSCTGEEGCSYEALTGDECLDGDICTVTDHCEDGVCVGQPVNCDDNNPCTTDTCDGLGGCQHLPASQLCDDEDPCTLGDVCKEGACVGSATLKCDDGNPCTDDSCGEEGCVNEPNASVCDDGNACTAGDTCQGGACTGAQIDCDDENLCTTDSCSAASGCEHVGNSQPCDDGDMCTLGDACAGGGCESGATSLPCNDGNPCTDDGCDAGLGCVFSPNASSCDDTNSCTTNDACLEGNCIGLGDLSCDDGNPCTKDVCLADGGCSHTVVAGACSDGDPCTLLDVCVNGACESGNVLSCDDGNPCTNEACAGGDCVFSANEEACDDGNACTSASACKGSMCVGTEMVVCSDDNPCTNDGCDVQEGCVHTDNQAPCSDGDPCSVGDACAGGVCESGLEVLACDDGLFCNGEETCVPEKGCVSGDAPGADDGVGCTGTVCDEQQQAVLHVPDNSLCPEPPDGSCQQAICDTQDGCGFETVSNCCGNGLVEEGEDCEPGVGCSDTCEAFPSCKAILEASPEATTGVYLIDTDGDGPEPPFDVLCDMDTDGGGWTLMGVIAGGDANRWNADPGLWGTTETTGQIDNLFNDYKSQAWNHLDITNAEVMYERYYDQKLKAQTKFASACQGNKTRFRAIFETWNTNIKCSAGSVIPILVPQDNEGIASSTYREGADSIFGPNNTGFCWSGGDSNNNVYKGRIMATYDGSTTCYYSGHYGVGVGIFHAASAWFGSPDDIEQNNMFHQTDVSRASIRLYAR